MRIRSWIFVVCSSCWLLFVFKQKTAYEWRISDWSSDVCSSDLLVQVSPPARHPFCRFGGAERPRRDGSRQWPLRAEHARDHGRDLRRVEGDQPESLAVAQARCRRSEEHTSALQSLLRLSYAVFCLKNKKVYKQPTCHYDIHKHN